MKRTRTLPENLARIASLLGILLIALLALFPVYWMLHISTLPEKEVLRIIPHYFPKPQLLTMKAYQDIFTKHSIFRYLMNSILICALATVLSLTLSISMAYSLTKFNFKIKRFLLYLIIWMLTLPWVVYVLPIFRVVSGIGLLDTRLLMILLYGFSGIPMFTWFALPFLHDFPNEIIDAARLDGCSEIRIVGQIVTPTLRNAIIALFLLRFIWAYNDLLFSLSFTFHKAKMILPAILEFPGIFETPFAKMAAGGVISVTPIILMVTMMQKYIVSGLTGRTIK